MRRLLSLFCLILFSSSVFAQFGPPPSPFQQKINAIMQSDIRSEADKARDQNRQPATILEFFRLQDDMRVIEIIPAGGWYSKILAPLLRENGQFYVVQPALFNNAFSANLALPNMDKIEQLDWNSSPAEGSPFGGSGTWNVEPVDIILTFRNYHNFSVEDRMAINKSSFDALKPGGLYGVIDHTRRHMETDNNENGRRVDPVLAIKEIQASGFVLLDYSDALRRSDDELRYEVGKKTVTGNTDRFTLLFMKPQ